MACELNAKHMDHNSRLTTAGDSFLPDYAIRNTCLNYEPDSPTTAPYKHIATPDVLDIVVVKDFVLPVYLTVCSVLSSDHLLARILREVSERGLLRDEQFGGFDPGTERHHSWPALLKESTETSTSGG
jgi:hypothetical protein